MKRKFTLGDRWVTRGVEIVTVTSTPSLKDVHHRYPVEVTGRNGIQYLVTVEGKEYIDEDSPWDLVKKVVRYKNPTAGTRAFKCWCMQNALDDVETEFKFYFPKSFEKHKILTDLIDEMRYKIGIL